jgi:hypothetical protein
MSAGENGWNDYRLATPRLRYGNTSLLSLLLACRLLLQVVHLMDIKYVLENEIARDQCPLCLGMWIRFNHLGKLGVFRLAEVEPAACTRCIVIDHKIESDPAFIVSKERWFEV